MQLGRYQVSTLRPPPIHSITFSQDGRYFAIAGEEGYEIWKSFPLSLVKRKILPGTLTLALLLPNSPLLILQGGGANPLYSPNKAVIFNDKLGLPIAEVEFGERIRGIKARNGLFCVALSRKVIAFEYGTNTNQSSDISTKSKGKNKEIAQNKGFWLEKLGEWETAKNEFGLMALSTSPGSCLLALPGRQSGHVQLISLPPCPPIPSSSNPASTAFRSPIILAHTHPLSTLSTTINGTHIMTTSERGTLLRIWDTTRGRLERELRRGVDKAEIWGCEFEGNGKSKVVGWSDKGTVHVWRDDNLPKSDNGRSSTPTPSTQTLTNLLSRNLPLPKYFSSSPSIAQYYLPRKNPHAISSALGKAGVNVPSMKNDQTDEESEMFIVGWVNIPIPINDSINEKKIEKTNSNFQHSSSVGGINLIGMGGRDERRSFGSGSDNTSSRTVTPTPKLGGGVGGGINLEKEKIKRSNSNSINRNVSNNFINKSLIQDNQFIKNKNKNTITTTTTTMTTTKVEFEKQLIVITYSGDWYRLRIPNNKINSIDVIVNQENEKPEENGEEKKNSSTKCELVEYRRLGIGGGGW
ncbi:uncharacterized protein I206_107587 [Kwoniella pini CBS 10737]|uniref:WD40 repeat-like protein n=1 Tax=Kwoniella pini CBS 10737 TaxID=1296096 RepID=A0A1B9HXP8_9TREE|nr:uncharacterized protein I206_05920 [Kwoniella pini CBS 10737]OCF48053.1 hypothetical protein I206_05920 [Kwoniella pini CBS 10737]